MSGLRSALFAVLALLWSAALSLFCLPLLALPRRRFQFVATLWCRGLLLLVRLCCGVRWQVRGREYLPDGSAILAVKHQSAWDTLIWHLLLPDPVYVLKRELLNVPVLGWYLRKGNIAIDRAAGFRALKSMLPAVDQALADGAQVIVFPEGTRAAPGERRPYQPGVAALYARADAPVIPVALNSGLFWGRRAFVKVPGVITLEVLPPMPPGLSRAAFLSELEERIETATARLCAETQGSQPMKHSMNIDAAGRDP